jgi:hypothetical protein
VADRFTKKGTHWSVPIYILTNKSIGQTFSTLFRNEGATLCAENLLLNFTVTKSKFLKVELTKINVLHENLSNLLEKLVVYKPVGRVL